MTARNLQLFLVRTKSSRFFLLISPSTRKFYYLMSGAEFNIFHHRPIELIHLSRAHEKIKLVINFSTVNAWIYFKGDGNVSFEEFVEIVSNMGGSAGSSTPTDQDQEEQELRDAFRVSLGKFHFHPVKKKKSPFHEN